MPRASQVHWRKKDMQHVKDCINLYNICHDHYNMSKQQNLLFPVAQVTAKDVKSYKDEFKVFMRELCTRRHMCPSNHNHCSEELQYKQLKERVDYRIAKGPV